MSQIRFVDLQAQQAELGEEMLAAVGRVLQRGDFILGSAVAQFEQAFGAYCGAPHAVGVASGLDALTQLLRAAEIGPGDEVITQCNTFIATVYSIEQAGAFPVLVDCRPEDLSMDLDQVEAAITPRTKAIVGVHLYGRLLDMDRLADIARRYGLLLLEDAAQAHGACAGPGGARRAGSLVDGAAFSFYPAKNLGAAGDGGIVTTRHARLADRIRIARNYGQTERYHHVVRQGTNSRLDTVQAAILLTKLPHLDRWNAARRQAANCYGKMLADLPLVLPLPSGDEHVWHLYVVQLTRPEIRSELRTRLSEAGIETGLHYPLPVHLQPAFAHLKISPGTFPCAEAAAERLLSLPMHPYLNANSVAYIADKLRNVLSVCETVATN